MSGDLGASDLRTGLTPVADQATEALVLRAARAWATWDAQCLERSRDYVPDLAPDKRRPPYDYGYPREPVAAAVLACDKALGGYVGLTHTMVRVRLCDWRRAGLSYETCVRLLLARGQSRS